MSFEYINETSESFASLQEKIESGESVVRSAHLGNLYPSQLLVAYHGIPMRLFDRNIQDRNYHPHLLISGFNHTKIADPNRFSMFQEDTLVHLEQAKKVFPNTSIVTERSFWEALREKFPLKDIFNAVLEISLAKGLWRRYVKEDGSIQVFDPGQVRKEHVVGNILNVDSDKKGWVMPNELNIVISTLLNANKQSGAVDREFHLAGPDMPRYINKIQASLREIYNELLKSFGNSTELYVPANFYLHIVPTAHVRYIAPLQHSNALSHLVQDVIRISNLGREKGERIKSAKNQHERGLIIEEFGKKMNELKASVKEAIEELKQIMYYDIQDARFFSQHDVETVEDLYVPEVIKSMSIQELYAMGVIIDRLADEMGLLPNKKDADKQQKRIRMMLSGIKVKSS